MSLSFETLNEILENTEKNFICLRCGECCFRWAVQFHNGWKKPENTKCNYLEDISIKNGAYMEANCKIYDDRPEQCKNFKIAFATLCPIGLWKWQTLKKYNPEIHLPKRITKILEILRMCR